MKALVLVNDGKRLHLEKIEFEDDTVLDMLHEEVGGYIERVPYFIDLEEHMIDAWINEDGKQMGLPSTIAIKNEDDEIVDIVVGNIVFTKNDADGRTVGLSDDIVLVKRFLMNE